MKIWLKKTHPRYLPGVIAACSVLVKQSGKVLCVPTCPGRDLSAETSTERLQPAVVWGKGSFLSGWVCVGNKRTITLFFTCLINQTFVLSSLMCWRKVNCKCHCLPRVFLKGFSVFLSSALIQWIYLFSEYFRWKYLRTKLGY